MQTVKTTLVLLMCFLLLAGCGLKGPLYLPAETPDAQPAIEQTTDLSAGETAEKEDPDKKDKDLS